MTNPIIRGGRGRTAEEIRGVDCGRYVMLSDEQAKFIVRVMDCLRITPSELDEDLLEARKELDVLYEKHGGWSAGSLNGRAEWLRRHLQPPTATDDDAVVEEIVEGMTYTNCESGFDLLRRGVRLGLTRGEQRGRELEREECAKVAASHECGNVCSITTGGESDCGLHIATSIRKRGGA